MIDSSLCPVKVGQSPDRGFWAIIFGRTIVGVGPDPLFIRGEWIVPVCYDDATYGIVRCQVGTRFGIEICELSAIRPNTMFVRSLLANSGSMPQVLPIESEGVLRASVDMVDDADEVPEGTVGNKTIYILNLFGVLGSRDRRDDDAKLFKLAVPPAFASKWA